MASFRPASFSCLFLFFLLLCFTCSKGQSIPAMYVFGDSLVDVGNNHYLPLSLLRADIPHNGVDYPGKKATGRFSNGKNAADFLAERVGLPTAPPYLSDRKAVFTKGVSFASGGAGIFNSSDQGIAKQTIPFALQVGYFSMVHQRLVKELGSAAAQEHISKSLFPIVIGSNDLIGYFSPDSKLPEENSPEQYVALMISTLKDHLKGLHGLGARKFLVIGTALIGCAPKQRFESATNECREEVNMLSNKYNQGLLALMKDLALELKDIRYTYFDTYNVFVDFIQDPATYGFKEIKAACCGIGKLRAKAPCTPISAYCSNRSDHLFWDIYHPTETAARIFINMLFTGSGKYVAPITVQQLISV